MSKLRGVAILLLITILFCSVPSYAMETAEYKIDVTTFLFGNISESQSVTFTVSITAPKNEQMTLAYKAVDEYGVIKDQNRKNITVTSDTPSGVTVEVNTGAYGVFSLVTELYSGNMLVSSKETDFSVMKKTTNVNEDVGICTQFNDDKLYHIGNNEDEKYMEKISAVYKDAGFSIWREPWAWDMIERDKGVFKLTPELQRQYNMHKDNGRDILMILKSGNVLYTETNQQYAKTEEALNAWYDYCYNLALMTKELPVTFEVTNEYDFVGTTEEYFALLKKAYTAVKAANPDAKVFGMVTSSANTNWMREVLDMGGAEYLDGISFHPYAWDFSPEAFNQMTKIENVHNLMEEYGIGDKEIWISEVGWYKYVGMENQASYSVRYLALNKINDYADRSMFHRYTYIPRLQSDEGFGLMESINADVPFSAFPALLALSNYNSIMTDAVYKKTVSDNCYMYTLKDNQNCIMLWADNQEIVSLDLGVESVILTDMYGNEEIVYGTNGKYTFVASPNVSYIKGSFADAITCENVSGIDKGVTYNRSSEFDKISVFGKGDAQIKASEGVDAFIDGKNIYVSNCNEKDGYVYVKIVDGNKCLFSGKIKAIKVPSDEKIIYDMESHGYIRASSNGRYRGVFHEKLDGEDVICFTFTTKKNEIQSYVFEKNQTGKVNISYDVYLTGNVNTEVTNEHAGSWAYMLGTSDNGYFVYGDAKNYDHGKKYETGRWYHLESIVDITAKTALYYVDGEYIGEETEKTLPPYIRGIRLGVQSASNDVKTYIKNFRITEYSPYSLEIDNVTPAEDNSFIVVEFSDAVTKNIAKIGIVSLNDKEEVPAYDAEKITSTKYRINLEKPLESGKRYAVTAKGDITSASGKFNGREHIFKASTVRKTPVVEMIYTVGEETRPIINGAESNWDIAVKLSHSANEESLSQVSLKKGDTTVPISVSLTDDKKHILVNPENNLTEKEQYTLEIMGVTAENGDAFENTVCVFDVLNARQNIYETKTESTEIFFDDFEEYSAVTQAGKELTFINSGKWNASKVVPQTEQWAGFGHYIFSQSGHKVLRGDAWQNGYENKTSAYALLGDTPITQGEYEIDFDLCVNDPEPNAEIQGRNYFTFSLLNETEEYPLFKVENYKIQYYSNGEEINTNISFSSSLTEFEHIKLRINMEKEMADVYISEGGKLYKVCSARLKESLVQNGFNRLGFKQSNSSNPDKITKSVDTSHIVDNIRVGKIYDPLILSKNGQDFFISNISEDDELKIKIGIDTAKYNRCSTICAYYDNGILKKADIFDTETTEDDEVIAEREFITTVPEFENLSIKCMIFDGINTIMPIAGILEK